MYATHRHVGAVKPLRGEAMANGPNQGQPEASQEVNLADDETPGPEAYDLQLDRYALGMRISQEGITGISEFAVKGPIHRAINYLVTCVGTSVVVMVSVFLCHLEGADGRITLAVGAGTGLAVFIGGLRYMTDRVPFRRPPSTT